MFSIFLRGGCTINISFFFTINLTLLFVLARLERCATEEEQSPRERSLVGSAVCPRREHSFDTVNDTASISLVINVIGSGHRGKERNPNELLPILQSHFAISTPSPTETFHTVRLVYKLYPRMYIRVCVCVYIFFSVSYHPRFHERFIRPPFTRLNGKTIDFTHD